MCRVYSWRPLSSDATSLELRYNPGANEEYPECVPTHEQVRMFSDASLKVHAPHISSVDVV